MQENTQTSHDVQNVVKPKKKTSRTFWIYILPAIIAGCATVAIIMARFYDFMNKSGLLTINEADIDNTTKADGLVFGLPYLFGLAFSSFFVLLPALIYLAYFVVIRAIRKKKCEKNAEQLKNDKAKFLLYEVPAICLSFVVLVVSVAFAAIQCSDGDIFLNSPYASFDTVLFGNFWSVAIIGGLAYGLYVIAVYGIRSKKAESLKKRKDGMWTTAVLLGSLGAHDFIYGRSFQGLLHLLLAIASIALIAGLGAPGTRGGYYYNVRFSYMVIGTLIFVVNEIWAIVEASRIAKEMSKGVSSRVIQNQVEQQAQREDK